jgi:UDP-N-acetylglucosamine 2-epimerase
MREAPSMRVIAVCGAGGLDPSAPVLGALGDAGVEVAVLSDELVMGASARTEVEQLSRDLLRVEAALRDQSADAILGAGESDLDLAGALVAVKRGTPVFRLAAGMRGMGGPAEVNRRLVDRLAALRICADSDARERLRAEGLAEAALVVDPGDAEALARTLSGWLDGANNDSGRSKQ